MWEAEHDVQTASFFPEQQMNSHMYVTKWSAGLDKKEIKWQRHLGDFHP